MTGKQTVAGALSRGGWLLLGFVLAAAVCERPALADDPGWVLTQKSATFGDQYLYVSKNGLKCYNPRAGFAFVTHAPDWTVTLYNEKTRVFYSTTVEKWKADMQGRGFGTDMQDKSWTKAGSSTISGLKATEYKMTGANTLHHGKQKATSISGATYWISDDITVPPQLTQLLATAYGLPTTSNIPLKLTYIEKGAPKNMLDTYRSQQASIPTSYFVCPSGLTPVKSDAEVMMTDEQKQIIDDMARDLDTGPKTSKQSWPTQGAAGSNAATASGAGPGGTINVGGVNLDKDKVRNFLDALKKGNK